MSIPDLSRLSDAELSAWVRGLPPVPAEALPDPEYLARQRRRFVEMCTLLGGWSAADALDDVDADGCGGLLLDWPPIPPRPTPAWPVDGCFDLSALGTAVDAAAKDGAK